MTEIKFSSIEYRGAEEELGGLADKLVTVANDQAIEKFGKTALMDPSDIEITPAVLEEPFFVIRAWHQTANDLNPGIIQNHDFSLSLTFEGEDMFIKTESDSLYPLTTREAILLCGLGGAAIINTIFAHDAAEND